MTKRRNTQVRTNAGRNGRRETPRIRILIADHHAIDRGGMVGLLEDEADFDVVGEAATLDEVVAECRALQPDVLVITLNLPGADDAPSVPFLRQALPGTRILAMSDRGTHNCMVLNPPSRRTKTVAEVHYCAVGTDCLALAAKQGARGTVRRSADPEDLFRAIRAVAAGQTWFDRTTTDSLVAISTPVNSAAGRGAPFSAREVDVASLIAEGMSNKEISSALGISEPTVKKHIGHILEKLGLQDRLQAGLHIARNPLMLTGVGNAEEAEKAPAKPSAPRKAR